MKWILYDINQISLNDIQGLKLHMSDQEVREIDTKAENLVNNMFFEHLKDRLLAKEFFKMGIIAGRTEFIKAE